ncbi:hypothetical protein GCM10022197_03680 [Microlunatus spumicola]|uniref:GAF domain-containing protein n=1 Tax=Microlunatus spumicola TaxID=81499 RepID=A0ABP6WL30_9ACTN
MVTQLPSGTSLPPPTGTAGRVPRDYLDAVRAGRAPDERLQQALGLLPDLVAGCHLASATTPRLRGLTVHRATDDAARHADELQHRLEEGPCLQALRTGHSVLAHDLPGETRWPRWTARASAELRLGAVLSVLLLAGRRSVGTLNLYSFDRGGLSDVDIAVLHALADPLTGVLVDVLRDR